MTTVLESVELEPVEIDLLCEFAEVRPPFPLRIPSTGRTEIERLAAFRAARERLGRRGLSGHRGPLGLAQNFVRLLRSGLGAVDVILESEGRRLAAVAVLDESRALLVTQSDGPVRLAELPVDELAAELRASLPVVSAGIVPGFTLPVGPLRLAFARMSGQRHVRLSAAEIDELLRESGVDELAAARLVNNLRQVDGQGQLGAARWSGGWRRLGAEVHWLDTPRGRFRLGEDGGLASVEPFTADDLRDTLAEFTDRVRSWP